jgi:MoaA/NifB/PqqE/SkfB family radical SAM enzyme
MQIPSISGLFSLVWRHPLFILHMVEKKLRFAKRFRLVERDSGGDNDVPLPLVYKLVLTNKCNLRCPMCYEWGSSGWHRQLEPAPAKEELDWAVIERILEESRETHPSFVLIGGEPLLYSRFAELAAALSKRRCFSICCTNGMFIEKHLPAFENNPYMTLLVSLDGQKALNDKIRGSGVFDKVIAGLGKLKELQRPPYVGIQHTLRPENISGMYDFCEAMVEAKVDWILFNPSWFLTKKEAGDYRQVLQTEFTASASSPSAYADSWNIDPHEFVRQYKRIRSRSWPIQISCYFRNPDDIFAYLEEKDAPAWVKPCFKQWLRMDVLPDATVTPCALYPDLRFGSLKQNTVREIWNCNAYAKFRALTRKAVLPTCRKCDVFYLYDSKRKVL